MKGNHTFKQHFQNAVKFLLHRFAEFRNHPLLAIYADDGRLKSEIDINEPVVVPSLEFTLEGTGITLRKNYLEFQKSMNGKKYHKKKALTNGLTLKQNYDIFIRELLQENKNAIHYDAIFKKYEVQSTVQPTIQQTVQPTIQQTVQPTVQHTVQPTGQQTVQQTVQHTVQPTGQQTVQQTVQPTVQRTGPRRRIVLSTPRMPSNISNNQTPNMF